MTTYNTRSLAAAIIGEEEVDANAKAATRTLRKFLRDDMGDGKAVVGKGGRYALDLKAAELRAMKKRFTAWEAKQEADKAARAALKEAQAVKKTDPIEEDDEPMIDRAINGPSDEEIAAMLADDDEV